MLEAVIPKSKECAATRITRRRFLAAGPVLAMPIANVWAQARYPSRPIRLIVPSVPGGVHDVIGRLWADRIQPQFGTIVVENRGGAGGLLGASDVAQSAPDGYSVLIGSTNTQVLVPATASRPPYDPIRNFAAVSVFATSSTALVINAGVPAKDLQGFIAYAKANPGKLSYGSVGNGSITNFAGELFKRRAGGLDIVQVPYKGVGPITSDLLGGQIPVMIANVTGQLLDLHRAGKLRILAINAGARLKAAPDIPTAAEAGLPDMVAQTFFGIFVPAATPRPIVAQLGDATQQIMSDPHFQKQLIGVGFDPLLDLSAENADRFVRAETARWLPVVRASGIKAE